MRKKILLLLVFVMVIALVVISCAQPAPAPKPAPTPAPAPAPAPPIELRFATMNPPTDTIQIQGYAPYAKKIEQATQGRIKVTIYPASSLGKPADFYNMVKSGIADLALGVPAFNPGQFPLSEITQLPYLGIPNAEIGGRIQWELYEKFPALQAEYPGMKMLFMPSSDPYFMVMRDKPVNKLEDMKGLKLRVPGGRPAEYITALGAVPVSMPITELYIAFEKGVIDGTPMVWEVFKTQLPIEKVKYVTTGLKLWVTTFWVSMNLDKWNSLSKKDQDAIVAISGKGASEWFGKAVWDDAKDEALKLLQKAGTQFYNIPPEEEKRWIEFAKPIHDKYIADLKAKGLPAQEVYDEALKLIQKYSK